jgi:hypothetical protein
MTDIICPHGHQSRVCPVCGGSALPWVCPRCLALVEDAQQCPCTTPEALSSIEGRVEMPGWVG